MPAKRFWLNSNQTVPSLFTVGADFQCGNVECFARLSALAVCFFNAPCISALAQRTHGHLIKNALAACLIFSSGPLPNALHRTKRVLPNISSDSCSDCEIGPTSLSSTSY
ncbi:unnamed protein product [Clavelina lepadiformis]|uniref:Uncharacterized protein n=1 Tax=Clavelina lepadiformis TaxID=159417 RepID=A0ABP0GL83_CLALP